MAQKKDTTDYNVEDALDSTPSPQYNVDNALIPMSAAEKAKRDYGVENFFKSLANSGAIQPLNAAPDLVNYVTGTHIPDIPQFKTEGGLSRVLGDIGGWMVPFGGEIKGARMLAKGAQSIPKVAAAMEAVGSKVSPYISRVAGGTASSLGAGALSSPTGQRMDNAKMSGLGGALGYGAVEPILRTITAPITRLGGIAHYGKQLVQKATPQGRAQSEQDATQAILDHYGNVKNQADNLYNEGVFNQLKEPSQWLEPKDFNNNWQKWFDSLSRQDKTTMLPHSPAGSIQDSYASATHPDGLINPLSIHNKQSILGNIQQKEPNSQLKSLYGQGRDMLQRDLGNHLQKKGLAENYKTATNFYKKNVSPILQTKLMKKYILPELTSEENVSMDTLIPQLELTNKIQKMKGTAPYNKIAKEILPGGDESHDSSFQNFKNMLGGDTNTAVQHTRNLLFSKHYDALKDEFDINGLRKDLSKLKDTNYKQLTTPEERESLTKMGDLDKLKLSPWKKAILGLAAGSAMGAHLGGGMEHGAEGAIGGAPLGLMAEHYMEQPLSSLLSTKPFQKIYSAGKNRKQISGALTAPMVQHYMAEGRALNQPGAEEAALGNGGDQ